jgi:hypothetical protein
MFYKVLMMLSCSFICCAVLCSCSSTAKDDSDDNYKLTDKESTDLVTVARFIILKNSKKFINDSERNLIETAAPEVKTSYTGPKTGKMIIFWSLPSRDIRIIATGELLSANRSWRVSVLKKEQKWQTEQHLVKHGKVEAKDFKDLIEDAPAQKTPIKK